MLQHNAQATTVLRHDETQRTKYASRLSDDEHAACVSHVLELRRIRKVLRQHTNISLLLQRSQLCGYGESLHEFEDAIANGEQSRERLITNHIPLVYSVVNDICRNRKLHTVTKEDLVQEGVIGLSRALEKYEPDFGTKLSTYSVFWIRAVVLRAIAEKDSTMYIPSHIQQVAAKLNKLNHWDEAHQAKAAALGVTDGQFREAMKLKQRKFVSFDALPRERDLMDTTTEATHDTDLLYVKKALAGFLRPKEVEALAWRYGLNDNDGQHRLNSGGKWGEAMSFTEVGKQMHVSAEYGRKLCHRAIKKLQQAVEEGSLELGLLMP